MSHCPECHGTGSLEGNAVQSDGRHCGFCDGTGQVSESTPKPTDALSWTADGLDALKEISEWGATASSDRAMHLDWIRDAIAQWEKERAELGRIEEKKAAFIEAARAAEGDEDAWASLRYKFRALGLVVESASKKEDAG